jgi:cystathionine beta-lyase
MSNWARQRKYFSGFLHWRDCTNRQLSPTLSNLNRENSLSVFDVVSDRLAWSATKWEKYRGRDVIPLWIADMDFTSAPAIQAAIAAQVARGNYGYMSTPRELTQTLIDYHQKHYDWKIEEDWIVWLPGLVLGINLAVKACCQKGEKAISFSPAYPPFLNAPGMQERELLNIPFIQRPGTTLEYDIDFARLEVSITSDTKLLQLCHPHNPLGRIYSREELDHLAELCSRFHLYVASDEVHADLILDGTTRHIPFAVALAAHSSELLARSITISGPGKAYNLAGIGIGWAIIPDPLLRTRFHDAMQKLVPDPSCFGYSALQAALTDAEDWRQDMLAYLRQNRDLVSAALDRMGLPHTIPQATYMTWIDARSLVEKVTRIAPYFEKHGVGFSDGADFGRPGYIRLNFACPRSVLEEALARMEHAVSLANANAA